MKAPSKTVLLVEDDPNDVFFLEKAFQDAGAQIAMPVVEDGQMAIEYLGGEGKYADRAKFPFPDLVLLDLKLPGKGGFDVLRWVKTRPELEKLLVIVLTSSRDPRDVEKAYRLGARSYLVKPISSQPRREMARAIKFYWLELNESPPNPPTSPPAKAGPIVTPTP
jgi:CheY-like chemotaxis protein